MQVLGSREPWGGRGSVEGEGWRIIDVVHYAASIVSQWIQ